MKKKAPWVKTGHARSDKGDRDHASAKHAKAPPRGNSVRATVVTGRRSSFVRLTVSADFGGRDE
jgi:hypothetical protein